MFTGGTTQTRTLAETMGGARAGTAAAIGDPVAATDADDEPLTYSLGGTDAGKLDFLASSAQLRTKANERYDFEAQPSYAVTVTVDDGTVSVSAAVTISLTDVDEPPLAPAAPTVTATPNATDSLSVSWSAPSNTGRPAIDSYDLQYREGTTGTWTDGPQNVSGTSTTIAGLAADPAAYQVQVRATNDEGDGPWSPTGRIGGGGGGARNDPPLAVDDAAETVENTAVFIDVLANDSDSNGDTLTVVEVSAPAHGTAVVAAAAAAGTVEYTPEPDFHGTDRFTYVVGDGSGLTARAAVEVTVLPVNDPLPAPFVIEGRVRAHVGLFDQGCREHALQAAIERSGAEIQTAVGLHRHILTNGVAMTLTIGKREQDMKDRWCQARGALGGFLLGHQLYPLRI